MESCRFIMYPLHAEFYLRGDDLWLRDHGSSNGTFRNRERLTAEVALSDGDIIHFSTNEFVLRRDLVAVPQLAETMVLTSDSLDLPEHFVGGIAELQELLKDKQMVPHYQPIVRLTDAQQLIGFEVWGRGGHSGLPVSPLPLLQLAESAGLESSLSRVFRQKGLFLAQVLPGTPKMFVKTHSSEIGSSELLESLKSLRDLIPDADVVLETHESAVNSAKVIKTLQAALSDLKIGLAYDNFGASEARLIELVEVPPDFIKIDMSLIRRIENAPVARQKMLETVVSMVNNLGIICIAKGLETAGELRICRELGFGYGQGYFIGRPAPVNGWLRPMSGDCESSIYNSV
ncbi:MAG: EAL domain-containing protein (putative c-di-GMP-specific phosphodiesterase class I) [Gammaproteobacteria bacterium]|jgi:EAL domain-containing protein (putative c-di-GMP-specific phosphodiesterase class I)